MDSLTQLVLGAAVGEAVAGKKLGNKAMLWGAMAGTLPDLDVISSLWMDDIQSMAFHRGISHSILFAVVMPLFLSKIAQWYYRRISHDGPLKRISWQAIWILLGSILIIGSLALTIKSFSLPTISVFLLFGGLGGYWIWRSFKHPFDDYEPISFKKWYFFFFLVISTHIAIDAFTTYGTQIFQPFHNARVTTSSISVADPFYTAPFLLFLIASSLFKRRNKWRARLNTAGLVISTVYMVFTFVNKIHVQQAFEDRLEALNYPTTHYMTNPTILNNFLWHGIAETDSFYVEAYYSLFDRIPPFDQIRIIPKNRELLHKTDCADSETIDILTWFSSGFYNYSQKDEAIYYNDLRFGSIWMDDTGREAKPVFYFKLNPGCDAQEIRETDGIPELLEILKRRIRGL